MSKTYALFRRMSPFLAKRAKNLIDAMLMSNEDISWDKDQQLIADGKVYYGTDMVELIRHVMSPDTDNYKPEGLKVFVTALKKIGLESEYVDNYDVKLALESDSESNDETESDDCDDYEYTDNDDTDYDVNSEVDDGNNDDTSSSEECSQQRIDSQPSDKSHQSYNWKSITDTESSNESDSNQDNEHDNNSSQDSTVSNKSDTYEWKSVGDTDSSIDEEHEES